MRKTGLEGEGAAAAECVPENLQDEPDHLQACPEFPVTFLFLGGAVPS
jgi:hypothetical protein